MANQLDMQIWFRNLGVPMQALVSKVEFLAENQVKIYFLMPKNSRLCQLKVTDLSNVLPPHDVSLFVCPGEGKFFEV